MKIMGLISLVTMTISISKYYINSLNSDCPHDPSIFIKCFWFICCCLKLYIINTKMLDN